MRRWMHVGLVTTATLVGMTALAPAAHAVTGDGVPATDTTATDPSLVLPPELLNCIATQVDVLDQISFNQVCQRWRTAAHKYPVFAQNLKVARTQVQLNVALNTAVVSPVVIVIVPDEDMTIGKAPVNPHAHITIHDTKPPHGNPVAVRADIHVTASGTATLTAAGSAQVTASNTTRVWAFGAARVTASDSATVNASGRSQVTATGGAAVVVRSAESKVFVRDSSVRLWVTNTTGPAVQPDDGVNPTITTCTSSELTELSWEEVALPTR